MKDFFTFYTDINSMSLPFLAFGFAHIVFVLCAFLGITLLFRKYNMLSNIKQQKFQLYMAIFFLVEEAIYTSWALLVSSGSAWQQVLPLELCSLCVYMNVLTVFLKKDYLRFFSGVVGLIAGGVAILYPANISGLYPVFSYRTINFYILHSSFILFSLIQLKDVSLLQYHYMKKNFIIVACMFATAFTVNLMLKTQYMFVGVPPQISFIASLYQLTGIFFFLPAVLVGIALIQVIVVFCLRKIYHVKQFECIKEDIVLRQIDIL